MRSLNPYAWLRYIARQLETIIMALADVQAAVEQLKADVAAENTVIDSAVTLLDSLKKQLDDALANATDFTALQQSIQDISATVGSEKTAIADAVTRNTPAAPTP